MTVQMTPVGVGSVRLRRSGAAQRAYERRQQRATVAGHPSAADSRFVSVSTVPKDVVARIPFVAAIIGLLCLGLAATLLLTTRSAEDSYELASARAHNQSLLEQTAALKRDVEAGNSAPILAQKAAEQGLIPARDPARLLQSSDGSVQVVGTPKPAEGKPVAPLDREPAPTAAPERTQQQARTTSPTATAATPPAATPQPVNDGRIQAQGEQLTPVTVITQPSVGARQ
ncbi:hypothetical protein C8K36_1011247 [Rhodococcus sp. OK519]|uniref:hypothetical protein n=1 Tax=Rhodococcus sp. OK519 TaxID=2135729 RepID=UPI000D3B45F7|nr:hypothetical protein C8K36_1011247 [Rhodococcus sp. OK519]